MVGLFSPYKLKDVTLRNRIGVSPMTMFQSVDGLMEDFHTMYLGARAAGGFGLVFPEQVAITPEGRSSVACAGIYDDAQIPGLAKVASMISRMGGVPGLQLGHTGRKGSGVPPFAGDRAGRIQYQLAPEHPDGWECVSPSAVPYGGKYNYPVHELSKEEIQGLYRAYAQAAERALEAGFQWLELHYAHGYLAASFFSPLSNHRTDEYGGSVENRSRFLIEALDAVREVWPERFPLTMRLGCDDHNPEGVQFEDALSLVGTMKEHGLDLADISLGLNTDDIENPPFDDVGFMVERAARIKREIDVPVATSWNLGQPEYADRLIREGLIDVILLGRPALANPHWPVWAARELGHPDPFSLVPQDWGWCLSNYRGHGSSIGWPEVVPTAPA